MDLKIAFSLPKQANMVSIRQSKFSVMTKGYWTWVTFWTNCWSPVLMLNLFLLEYFFQLLLVIQLPKNHLHTHYLIPIYFLNLLFIFNLLKSEFLNQLAQMIVPQSLNCPSLQHRPESKARADSGMIIFSTPRREQECSLCFWAWERTDNGGWLLIWSNVSG